MTAPDVTVKSVASKLAIPLLVSVASSADIVMVLSVTAVSIPSPPVKVNLSVSRLTVSSVPVSAPTVSTVDTSWKVTEPLPSVTRACPLVPSVLGKV